MTPRSIRRAAERKANKLARKAAANQSVPATESRMTSELETPAEATATSSEPAIVPADAANLHISAVISALTGHATLIAATDAAPYAQLLRDYQKQYEPVGLHESELVQTLAGIVWRMRRTVALESALFAKGRIEFAEEFAEHKPELRESLIELHTFLTYEKQIRGLQQQEARFSRRSGKLSAELRESQKERREKEMIQARQTKEKPRVASNGFEFTNYGIEPSPRERQSEEFYGSGPSAASPQAEAA